MAYDCRLVERSEQPALTVRKTTPVEKLPELLGSIYASVAQHLGSLGQQPASCPPFVAYHNMDMQALDIEAGFAVNEPLEGEGDVRASCIPAGKYAACLHVGPYSTVGPAYDALSAWMEERGHVPTGVAYEYYINDPATTLPEELETRIEFLLAEE